MIAGLAIQVQRPFDEGDWIQFDAEAKHIGRVVEINWRATKVVTLDEVEVTVPNATLAKAPIVNFTKPTGASRRSLYVQVPASVPPALVQRTILDALPGSLGVLDLPAPSVVNNGLVDGNVEYWVRFFTVLFDRRDGVDGAARDHIWYAFSRAGIPFALPNRNVELREITALSQRTAEEATIVRHEASLATVDFLRGLAPEVRRTLAERARTRMYLAGETIVRQGDESGEMFLVEAGEVAVVVESASASSSVEALTSADAGAVGKEVARLGVGKFFGEMSLMTGERRTATVRAKIACTLLVLDHAAVRTVLAAEPALAEHISRVIAERQAALTAGDALASAVHRAPASVDVRSSELLGMIKRFFSL
jgi:CRP-like cAMP-binding protein